MTFIVAIPCKDGVAIASDGQATRLVGRQPVPVKAPKIFELSRSGLWGCSGQETDVQKFRDTLGKGDLPDKLKKPFSEPQLKECLGIVAHIITTEASSSGGLTGEYLVVGHQKYPMVWQMHSNYSHNFFGKDEYKTEKCTMFAVGSITGHWVTQAFFNNLTDSGLELTPREYSLEQGSLIAYRLVKEAIKIDRFVGEPIDAWTITNNKPRRKSEAELEELEISYHSWVNGERLMADGIMSRLIL